MENPVSLDVYKRYFSEARDLLQDGRKESRIDDDYYHGYQLTREERETLKKRGQPDGIFNRVRKAVNGTLGVLKQGETDPRAYPRNPQDEDSADVASKVLRYLADVNKIDARRIDAAYDYLGPGTCAALIDVDGTRPNYSEIHWEEFFYDPRSRKPDFRDAKYMGIAKWMFADDIEGMWPQSKSTIDSALSIDAGDETWEDRPTDSPSQWVDSKRRRLMVVEIYCKHGQEWTHAIYFSGGWLQEPQLSGFLDKKGKPVCPIIAQSCYVDRENQRYGIIRDMRAPQDEFNKRRQKLLHMLNNRQVQASGNEAAMAYAFGVDADEVRRQASRPDGVIPVGWEPVSQSDLASGQFNLLGLAESEMDREGPNPAILARGAEQSSGRAQLVRQQAGLTEQAVIFGGIEDWEHRIYEALWDRARQFMQAPEWVRITDDEGAPQFLQINEPIPGPPQVVMGPDGMPMIQPTVVGYNNRLAELDVDITLDTVPDTANLAQEEFMALVDLAKIPGNNIPFDVIFEASSLPRKRQIMEKMQQKGPDPMQQAAMELQMQQGQANVKKTESEVVKNLSTAQATQAGIQLDALDLGIQTSLA